MASRLYRTAVTRPGSRAAVTQPVLCDGWARAWSLLPYLVHVIS